MVLRTAPWRRLHPHMLHDLASALAHAVQLRRRRIDGQLPRSVACTDFVVRGPLCRARGSLSAEGVRRAVVVGHAV